MKLEAGNATARDEREEIIRLRDIEKVCCHPRRARLTPDA